MPRNRASAGPDFEVDMDLKVVYEYVSEKDNIVFESQGLKINAVIEMINQDPTGDISPGSESRTGNLESDLKTDLKTKIIEDHEISRPHAIHVGTEFFTGRQSREMVSVCNS
jgi:hypothetical protein